MGAVRDGQQAADILASLAAVQPDTAPTAKMKRQKQKDGGKCGGVRTVWTVAENADLLELWLACEKRIL